MILLSKLLNHNNNDNKVTIDNTSVLPLLLKRISKRKQVLSNRINIIDIHENSIDNNASITILQELLNCINKKEKCVLICLLNSSSSVQLRKLDNNNKISIDTTSCHGDDRSDDDEISLTINLPSRNEDHCNQTVCNVSSNVQDVDNDNICTVSVLILVPRLSNRYDCSNENSSSSYNDNNVHNIRTSKHKEYSSSARRTNDNNNSNSNDSDNNNEKCIDCNDDGMNITKNKNKKNINNTTITSLDDNSNINTAQPRLFMGSVCTRLFCLVLEMESLIVLATCIIVGFKYDTILKGLFVFNCSILLYWIFTIDGEYHTGISN